MEPSTSGLKRKCISPVQEKSFKTRKIQTPVNILALSDCILLEILKHLDATALYQLGLTCNRFRYLVEDQILWVHVEGRSEPNTLDKINFCWKNVGQKTKSLKLCGDVRSRMSVSSKIIHPNLMLNLTVLALEHQCITYCRLSELPGTLQELSFRHSFIPKNPIFFRFSEKRMCNLRVLLLDHCKWFNANNLTSLCRYPKLEILSLYMCTKLTEDEIANVSLAGRHGFRALKVADLRFTGFGDVFVRAFYANPSIEIIYFQCYGTMYASDRYKRKLDIINGAKMNDYSHLSDDEENNTSDDWIQKRFNAKKTQKYETQTIKDLSMVVYKRAQKVKVDSERPKSVLYKYPYETCTCGFYSKYVAPTITPLNKKVSWDADVVRAKLEKEIAKQRENRADMKGGEIYFMHPNRSKICVKILYDSCMMPDWCHVEATPSTPIHKWLYIRSPKNDFEISMLEHVDKHYLTQVESCCDLDQPCGCLSSPLHGNSIVSKASFSIQNWPFFDDRFLTMERHLLVSNYCKHFPVFSSVVDCIKQIKYSSNGKHRAEDMGYRLVKSIFESEGPNYWDVLKDKEFMQEICQLIYQFAMRIQFSVFNVIVHHSGCFEDLCRHIRSRCDVKECIKFFFTNLLNSLNVNILKTEKQLDLSMLQFNKEKQEADQLVVETSNDSAENNCVNNLTSILQGRRCDVRRVIIDRQSVTDRIRIEGINIIGQQEIPKDTTTSLKELSLRGYTHITDLTLMILKDLDLGLLDITGTNVTAEGAQQFMTYNPQCWLIHETACVCRPSLHF